MKDYYQVLGVSRHSTSSEIKIAYRKLAIVYHPDRNNTAVADEKIKEINEAYRILGDKVKRWEYDQKTFRPIAQGEGIVVHRERHHGRHTYASHAPRENISKKSDRQKIFETMHRYLFLSYRISFVSFLFCLFLVTDYWLPFEHTTLKVQGKYSYFVSPASASQQMEIIETHDESRFKLNQEHAEDFQVGEEADVTMTRLVHVPISIQELSHSPFTFSETIYSHFVFIPALLLIVSILALFFKHSIEFRFNLMIVNAFLLIVNVLILFSHKIFL